MKPKILLTSLAVATVLSTSMVNAGGLPKDAGISGYVTDSTGHIYRDLDGHCVQTLSWTPELSIAECDGAPRVVEQPKVVQPQVTEVTEPPAAQTRKDSEFVGVTLQAGALFDVDKSELKPRGKEKLDVLARKLKETISTDSVDIEGHTDATGTDAYNQKLSERRAQAVKNYLALRGIPAERIHTAGYGEARPIASNASVQGRSQNRRVEVKIRATKQIQ